MNSELYPIRNKFRQFEVLDGLWKFRFDPEGKGETEEWYNGLKDAVSMPVPASFADLFTDAKLHDYCGDFWYETSFYGHAGEQIPWIRFGSVTHRCTVFLNGIEVGKHEGGYLPVVCNLSAAWKENEVNRLSVKVNNELSETSLPCGTVKILPSGRKIAKPYFDFFNYAGIHRSVWLEYLPENQITDYDTDIVLNGNDADVTYTVYGADDCDIHVSLLDQEGKTAAECDGRQGVLHVTDAHLWQVRNAYLYTIRIDAKGVDSYTAKLGIRTVKVEGTKILVNGQPVYLKGFGKHEDFDVIGKAFNWAVAKRDFACMEWTNANCFRTSHYPYAEEWYQLADEEGFLIIDEIPAVGMMRSTHNFAAAGKGGFTRFFQADTVPELKKNHLAQVQEMITRDKNHPSVISFSLFNEPETTSIEAHNYFKDVFAYARTLDPQHRPFTGALEKNSAPELCQVYMLCDFICLNRYYGWYISGGDELEEAEVKFRDEMDRWAAKNLNVPFVFTEFGTDTMPGQHNLPGIMWSEEYQKNYYEMNFSVFDSYDFVQGELTWNFADFATSQGIMRVNGNRKGVFTRERQPKEVAFLLKDRWVNR